MGRKQGTGKPDSKKDRNAHEAARGTRQKTLPDLSKQLPTEEQLKQYPDLAAVESDRGAAIMASALLEQALRMAITCRLTDHGDEVRKAWFDGDNAPFGTFAAKIQLGLALGIYGEKMHGRLMLIKNIRNQFAHCSVPLGFDDPTIEKAVKKMETAVPLQGENPIRTRFVASCLAQSQMLTTDAFEQGGKEIKIRYK